MSGTCEVETCEKPASAARLCSMHYSRKKRHGSVDIVERVHGDPLASFNQKVDKSGDCWEWTGSRYKDTGYGQFAWKEAGRRAPTNAHRAAWMLLVGPIPEGMFVDHLCHNRGCVNPEHLRLATPKQNNENHSGRPRVDSTSGVRGVFRYKDLWLASVQHNYKHYDGGLYTTIEAAEQAVINLRNALFTHNDRDRVQPAEIDPDQFRAKTRRKRGEPPVCGTTSMYRLGCRCEDCGAATREYKRQARTRKRQADNHNQEEAA